jgi:cell wall-associated NlpC family hydrolase
VSGNRTTSDTLGAATMTVQRPLSVLLCLASLSAGACATTTGARPQPFPMPERSERAAPPDAVVAPALSQSIVDTALELRGVPYRDGGADMAGFDCSGFTQYVFARFDVRLPRETRDQYRHGRAVGKENARPGDLVFFSTVARGASHVGIIVDGDRFVHAPSSTGVVRVESMDSRYWRERLVGIRRIEPN